jgi:hypothetical protein
MRTEFFGAILPKQGLLCAVAIEPTGAIHQKFFDSFSEMNELLNDCDGLNVYVAPNTFKDHSRLSSHAAFAKSFFVDLDVGLEKPYKSKSDAIDSLNAFTQKTQLPPPVIIDSGTGIHGYWPFDTDLTIDVWRPYAKLFKQFCINNGLHIDVAVTADAARIMRCPDTYNYKTDPPSKAYVISENIPQYSFDLFKMLLGPVPIDPLDVLAGVERGLDEDSSAVASRGDYAASFTEIVQKSLGLIPGEPGCAQIDYIIQQPNKVSYPLWFAGLSIAARCDDSHTAIHDMSNEYDGYNEENTEFKAAETLKATGPHECDRFDEINPGLCSTCPHRGKISTPLVLGRKLKTAVRLPEEVSGTSLALVTNDPVFPKSLFPFVRAQSGGIYMMMPDDDEGTPCPPLQLLPYTLYPTKRMTSAKHGACMVLNYDTPRDGKKEMLLYMNIVYAVDKLSQFLLTNDINPDRRHIVHMMDYIHKWFDHMQRIQAAELMQTQMGWTDDRTGFVLGDIEIRNDGTQRAAASSPYVKGMAKLLVSQGEYQHWRAATDYLDAPGMELHAFAMMCAFGSPLMCLTATSGVCVSFYGPTGVAKTGALYACLGIYGNPKELSVYNATGNAAVQRMLTLHNIPYGRDEATDMDPLALSALIHSVSSGKSKVRMQSSADAERELERDASMIMLLTSNHALEARLQMTKANPEGEMARTVEFFIDQKPELFAKEPEIAKAIFDTFRTCYGHAGPMYIKEVYRLGFVPIIQKIDNWARRFRMVFGKDTAYRYYEGLVSTTFAGTEVAIEAGILKFDLERVFTTVMRHICSMKENVMLDNQDYGSIVGEYIHRHTQNTLIMDGGRVVVEPRGELKIRVDMADKTQIVSRRDFKKYLATLQISPKEFELKIKQENLLDPSIERQRLSNGWRNGNTTPVIFVYAFKANVDEIIKEITNVPDPNG